MDRRHFLRHVTALSASGMLTHIIPGICAWAQQGQSRPHLMIFVFASGGWDPTMVFDPKFGNSYIDVDPDGELAETHGLTYVHNPKQPAVKRFLDDFGQYCCFINGVNTQSISHFVGTEIILTGSSGMHAPDWPTAIASENGKNLMLPNMALSGPSFTGLIGQVTFSGSGFLSLLLSEGTHTPPGPILNDTIRAYEERRLQHYLSELSQKSRTGPHIEELEAAFTRIRDLNAVKNDLGDEFRNIDTLEKQGIAAASAFQKGYTISATMTAPGHWDSHSANFPYQNEGFQNLFDGLHGIVSHLLSVNATSGPGTLLDQTTIFVLSEMGRTPGLNGSEGKDHWQFTSLLAIGSGIRTGVILGGTDDLQTGLKVDYNTGLVDPDGKEISAGNIGAAILLMNGIDPSLFLPPEIAPFKAFIANT